MFKTFFFSFWLAWFHGHVFAQALDRDITPLNSAHVKAMKKLLAAPHHSLDYLEAKLVIDTHIAPFTFSKSKVRAQITDMVRVIHSMIPVAPSETEKLMAVKRYLYEAGDWNNHAPYSYDFDDPLGTQNPKGPMLYNYLETRKGNCVSMPILFLILADRLGLDVSLTHAPKHMLVYFVQSRTQKHILIETTSGGNPSRGEWIAEQFNITPHALKSGIYLHKLNKRQSIASMMHTFTAHLYENEQYYTAIALADLHRTVNDKFIDAILTRGASYGWLADYLYRNRYDKFWMIPQAQQKHADFVTRESVESVIYAQSLGWKEETPDEQQDYLEKLGHTARRFYN